MSLDGCILVADERAFAVTEGDSAFLLPPVTAVAPAPRLVRVSATCPANEHLEYPHIALREDALGDARAVIQRPAPDDGLEFRNQGRLRVALVFADDVPYLLQMAFDGFLTGFDDGLEPRFSLVRPRALLAHTVLSDVEA